MHLELDEVSSFQRGHSIPPVVRMFIAGSPATKYIVNANQVIVPHWFDTDLPKPNSVYVGWAWRMCQDIATAISQYPQPSLANAIGHWLDLGYIKWVEDTLDLVDEQPDDYLDPNPPLPDYVVYEHPLFPPKDTKCDALGCECGGNN